MSDIGMVLGGVATVLVVTLIAGEASWRRLIDRLLSEITADTLVTAPGIGRFYEK